MEKNTKEIKFIKLKFPGYWYEESSERIFSLKVDGILKPIYKHTRGYDRLSFIKINTHGPYFQISVKGRRRNIFLKDIKAGQFNYNGEDDIIALAVNINLEK